MTFWQILRATKADPQVRTPLRRALKRTSKAESVRFSKTALSSGSNIVQRGFKESCSRGNGGVAHLIGLVALQDASIRRDEVIIGDMITDINAVFAGICGDGVVEVEGEMGKMAKIQMSGLRKKKRRWGR